jgi:hypothetical protein
MLGVVTYLVMDMITVSPTSDTIILAQTITLTVSIDSTDPTPPPFGNDILSEVLIVLAASVPSSVTVSNFTLPAGLPARSMFTSTDAATRSANIAIGNYTFSSFKGDVYSPPAIA